MTDTTVHTETTEDARLDAMWEQRCATLNRAWVQVRYHGKRQRFFDWMDKATKAITVVLGASLMGQYFVRWLPWLATAITSLGLLALVFTYGDRKQLHKDLGARAARLVADIERVPVAGLTFERTAQWSAEYAEMDAESPPSLKTLTIICEHEQASAEGFPDHVTLPNPLRRAVAYIV